MTKMSKYEYLRELWPKYQTASKAKKSQLLDDFCEFTGYHRKYALALLAAPLTPPKRRTGGRKKIYDHFVVDAVLFIWKATNKVCGERLQPFIPEMRDKLLDCQELTLTTEVSKKLDRISLATVKRIVRTEKNRSHVRIGGTTKPGSLLKSQIAIRYGRWEEVDPGYCETDTVAHCGGDVSGEFIYSLDVVDVCTSWSEQAAIWGKGEQATTEKMDAIRTRLPFPLLGLDPDNGSEFINWQLHRYCKKHGIELTRSRPYKKNDNAHVEQKNYVAIRQLIGYDRLAKKQQLAILNDLYANEWRTYINLFQPTRKLKKSSKDTTTGKTKKEYYESKTPYRRLLDHPKTSEAQKALLESMYKEANPVKLLQIIEQKLELLQKTLQ